MSFVLEGRSFKVLYVFFFVLNLVVLDKNNFYFVINLSIYFSYFLFVDSIFILSVVVLLCICFDLLYIMFDNLNMI